jgi:hypothetical protein
MSPAKSATRRVGFCAGELNAHGADVSPDRPYSTRDTRKPVLKIEGFGKPASPTHAHFAPPRDSLAMRTGIESPPVIIIRAGRSTV